MVRHAHHRGCPVTTNTIMVRPNTCGRYSHVSHKRLSAMMDWLIVSCIVTWTWNLFILIQIQSRVMSLVQIVWRFTWICCVKWSALSWEQKLAFVSHFTLVGIFI